MDAVIVVRENSDVHMVPPPSVVVTFEYGKQSPPIRYRPISAQLNEVILSW